ncbi:TaqI family restriction endonuclease [bacterium]|nr:TaqI family restriction endonuclease [bacterium]
MIDNLTDFERFRRFLESIPLDKYREELRDVKWVEQNLYKEILPLESIFKYYWEKREFLSFEDWFENFWTEINTIPEKKEALEKFKRYYFNRRLEENDWFKKGFKARMYRTWVSLLTQLDFCYVFEYVASKKNLNLPLICDAELDARGIDAMVNDICFQIAKISERKEARAGKTKRKIVPILYAVYDLEKMKRSIWN